MKVLVMGVGGQVGSKVAKLALQHGDTVVGAYRSRPLVHPGIESIPLDKTDPKAVNDGIGRVRPDVVIDTGALHNVDYCESHPADALAVNRDGTGFAADAAFHVGARFVFVSTDYVFDGSGHPPYVEGDETHPQSVYARSKLEAEGHVLIPGRDAVVARPSVIYSWTPMEAAIASTSGKPLNFGSWFVRQLIAGKEVRIVEDQVATPTLADDLAGALLALARSRVRGLFHAAGTTRISRYDFCLKVAGRLDLPTGLIQPVSTSDLHQVAARPKDSSLRSDRLRQTVGYAMKDLSASLDIFAQQAGEDPAFRGTESKSKT